MAGWKCTHYWDTMEVHVHPINDLICHEEYLNSTDCICGPSIEAVPREDGTYGWIVKHHSLDGREQNE